MTPSGMEPATFWLVAPRRRVNIRVPNISYGALNRKTTTGDGKEFLCMFPLFKIELSATVDKTFAVKKWASVERCISANCGIYTYRSSLRPYSEPDDSNPYPHTLFL
jgi:hypothetical protein